MRTSIKRVIALMAAVLIVLATVAGDYVKVTGTHVRLRHSASLQGKIYSNANGVPIYPDKGALLQYTGERGDFYQVNYQGRTLYISKQFSCVVSGSGTSRSAGQSRDTRQQQQPYHFFNSASVIDYLQNKTFSNGSDRIRITFQGVYLNGTSISGAPRVVDFDRNSAYVVIDSYYGIQLRLSIDPVNHKIIDRGDGRTYYWNK